MSWREAHEVRALPGLVRTGEVDKLFAAAGVQRAQQAADQRRRLEDLAERVAGLVTEQVEREARLREERRDLNAGWGLVGVSLTAMGGAIIGGMLAGYPGWWAAAVLGCWAGYLIWLRRCEK